MLISAAITALSFVTFWNAEMKIEKESVFSISRGESPISIAENLALKGYISRPNMFRILLRLKGYDRRLKAGKYLIAPHLKIREFVTAVSTGSSIPDNVDVQIREGSIVSDIIETVQKAGVVRMPIPVESTLMGDAYNDYWFLRDLARGESLLGYLFPDTYSFKNDSNPEDIIEMILENTDTKLQLLGIKKPDYRSSTGLNIHEILILASIVQKESVAGEMRTIAGVFSNRLRQGWRLESDATINFILGTSKLIPNSRDIHAESPFNTYLHKGLPPSPISSPGYEAISAVLNPEDHRYFFFLHTPDSQTILSRTFDEHLAARAKYWG